ncbi:MAG: S-layer homology domain-containing protein, partial [Firmicutes bacterium]|nr:S-layer homology domain-containing protein [Bacillota bacterium]
YAKAVAWAYANGITAGKSATVFGADEPCTRGQIVTFLYNAIVE